MESEHDIQRLSWHVGMQLVVPSLIMDLRLDLALLHGTEFTIEAFHDAYSEYLQKGIPTAKSPCSTLSLQHSAYVCSVEQIF